MNDNCSTIMAVLQEQRMETAVKVQDILTKFGCHIRVRLGLHDAQIASCANSGIILLQVCADNSLASEIEKELKDIPNVKVKSMELNF